MGKKTCFTSFFISQEKKEQGVKQNKAADSQQAKKTCQHGRRDKDYLTDYCLMFYRLCIGRLIASPWVR